MKPDDCVKIDKCTVEGALNESSFADGYDPNPITSTFVSRRACGSSATHLTEYANLCVRLMKCCRYPILLASESSLADLNSRLDSPVQIIRFRPNIVVGGDLDPFEAFFFFF